MSLGMLKIMSAVLPSCMILPLRVRLMLRLCGSLISSGVTIAGPSGRKPSKPLPLAHCPPPACFCIRRAVISLAQV